MWTQDLFETFDFVNDVVMKTRLTEFVLMLAVTYVNLSVLVFGFFYLSFTNLACGFFCVEDTF